MEPQHYTGVVEKGEGTASRDFGVPTANISCSQPVKIDPGVYAAMTTWRGTAYESVVCYGVGSPPKFEVHLLCHPERPTGVEGSLNVNLYGEELTVVVLAKISDLVPWESKPQMQQKILRDLELVRAYFSKRV